MRAKLLSAAALAAAVHLAHAQVWGTTGSVWETLTPTGTGPTGPQNWHHAASAAGCFFTLAGDGTTGNATFQFDPTSNAWSKYPDLPMPFRAPGVATWGGMLALFGGGSNGVPLSSIYVTSTTNWTAAGWTMLTVGNAPSPRMGARFITWGGYAFLFGGYSGTAYFNDLQALDLNAQLLSATYTGQAPGQWTTLVANGTVGMPAPRDAFTWDVYGHDILMFGGFQHNAAAGSYIPCTTPGAQCVFYQDLWLWRPGNPGGLSGFANVAAAWTLLTPTTNVLPPGRFGHASGVLADQLFIYGGIGAYGGPLADLWAFNLVSMQWAQVTYGGAAPPLLAQPAGLFIGRWLYVLGSPNAGGSVGLWRWTPATGALPPPASSSGSSPISTAGLTAAAVLSLLLLVAIFALAFILVRRTGGLWRSSGATTGDIYATLDQRGA